MKVLLVNGSPRPNSNTLAGLHEMEKVFAQEGIEVADSQVLTEDKVAELIKNLKDCHNK